jgi:hypothetical protein
LRPRVAGNLGGKIFIVANSETEIGAPTMHLVKCMNC